MTTVENVRQLGRLVSLLLLLAITGCSSGVRLSMTGANLISRPVDIQAVESGSLEAYNRETREALGRWITAHTKERGNPLLPAGRWITTQEGKQLEVLARADSAIELNRIDRFILADSLTITKGIREQVTEMGIGVPLIGRIPYSEDNKLVPKSGLWLPLSAALIPSGDQSITLEFIDPTVQSTFSFSDEPASIDLTAALAKDFVERQKDFQKAKALIRFDKYAPYMGINRMFGFSPRKRPVVLVHGIFSSSVTWSNTINELVADPLIRENFEFWTYTYPTGAPIPFLASELRTAVQDMQNYRMARGAPREQDVIMIGHSMGGLMSKALTQQSDQQIWEQIFTRPAESLPISQVDRDLWAGMFQLAPLPNVKKVIFTATPHRGSSRASGLPARAAIQFIRLPDELKRASKRLLISDPNVLTPFGRSVFTDFPNAMQHMQVDSPMGNIYSKIPLNSTVEYHSIVGSKDGLHVPKEFMTDGVVEYKSSKVEDVLSEKILHSPHGVHAHEGGIKEIARILRESLDQ